MKFTKIRILRTKKGNAQTYFNTLFDNPQTLILIGKKGSGKSALGFLLLEQANKNGKETYVLNCPKGKEELIPLNIGLAYTIDDIPNGSVVLVDEAGTHYNARRSMTDEAIDLSKLLSIARHKGLFLIHISQNSAIADINILRLSDAIILKEPSLLQEDLERGILTKLYKRCKAYFTNAEPKERVKFFYIISADTEALCSFYLPQGWNEELSKIYS